MGKGSNETQRSEPWAGQQGYLRDIYGQAQNLFHNGQPTYYPGSTVVPSSDPTRYALNALQSRAKMGSGVEDTMQNYVVNAMQNPGGQATHNFLQNTMQNPGMFNPQDPSGAYSTLGGFGQGTPDFAGSMGGIPRNAFEQSASGGMLNSNPYLDDMFNTASRSMTERFNDAVLPGLNATFAGAGGAGSGIHREIALDASDELGQNLTDLASNIYGGNYARERGLQMNAAGALNADDLSRRGLSADMFNYDQNRALTGSQSLLGDNLSRMMGGANLGLGAAQASNQLLGTQGDISRGAAALAPTASGLDYQNIQQLLNAGQIGEGYQQQQLSDLVNRHNFNQMSPWDSLARYTGAVQGSSGAIPGTATSHASGNPIAGAAGGALTAGGLAGAFPGTLGALGGPWGMLGGAVLGGLLS